MTSEQTIDEGQRNSGPIAAGIRGRLSALNPAEAKVATTLLGLGDQLVYRTASEVAELAGAALSTVVRTCQVLGFRGFQDLKISLAREQHPPSAAELQDDVSLTDSATAILGKIGAAARDAVDYGLTHVNPAQFEKAVAAVAAAERVLCLGVGTSAPLAQDLANRLGWIGVRAEAPTDVHIQHIHSASLTSADVAVVVSHTGSTRETVTDAQAARTVGATVVSLTSFPRSPLTELSDLTLVAPSRETAYRVEALTSRIAHLTVIDALWVAVAVKLGDAALGRTRAIADIISDHRF